MPRSRSSKRDAPPDNMSQMHALFLMAIVVFTLDAAEPGFQTIFDGTSLNGWKYVGRGDASGYRVENGTIVNFVHKNAENKPVLISHQGFLIREGGTVYLRHASSGDAWLVTQGSYAPIGRMARSIGAPWA